MRFSGFSSLSLATAMTDLNGIPSQKDTTVTHINALLPAGFPFTAQAARWNWKSNTSAGKENKRVTKECLKNNNGEAEPPYNRRYSSGLHLTPPSIISADVPHPTGQRWRKGSARSNALLKRVSG